MILDRAGFSPALSGDAGTSTAGVPLLQYAATANSQAEVDLKLDFLQDAVTHLEIVNSTQAEKDAVRITEKERIVCRRVADAFAEMYSLDLMVLDAGQYGFVKL